VLSKENVTFVGETKLKALNNMKPMIKYRGTSIKNTNPEVCMSRDNGVLRCKGKNKI
jgi:hypothetical protein